MDVPAVLERLGYAGQRWGSMAQRGARYEEFVAKWRGSVSPPTRQEMQDAWAAIQSERVDQEAAQAQADARRQRIRDQIGDRSELIDLAVAAALGAIVRGDQISSIPQRYRRVLQRLETIALDETLWPGDES